MQVKAIIHDWDDTITNSFKAYQQFYYDFADYYLLDTSSIPLKVRQHWGGTVPQIVAGIWFDTNPQLAEEKTKHFYGILKEQNKLYTIDIFKGVKETLALLKESGIKLGVISSGSSSRIKQLCKEHFGSEDKYHDFIFDNLDLGYPKPDPRLFDVPLKILNESGIGENGTIYVGDSFQDYELAQNRGLTFYAVTTGVKTKEDFMNKGLEEKFILNSFSEIAELFI